MSLPNRARRWSARGAAAAMALLAASAATQAGVTAAQAGGAPEAVAAGHPRITNPYAPAYHHLYRGGAVPTRGAAARMAGWARQHPDAVTASPAAASGVGATSARNVRYGGGGERLRDGDEGNGGGVATRRPTSVLDLAAHGGEPGCGGARRKCLHEEQFTLLRRAQPRPSR